MTDYLGLDARSLLPPDVLPPDVSHPDVLPPDVLHSDAELDAGSHPTANPLRRQVLGIIEDVLDDGDPACAGARSHLRHFLAHNAGSPEKALLEHLLALHGSELHGEPEESGDEEPRD